MTSGCVVVTRVLYLVSCIHGDIPFNNNYPPIMDRIVGTRAQAHIIIIHFCKSVLAAFLGILLPHQSTNIN